MNEITNQLMTILKRRRKEAGLSLKQLEQVINVSASTLSRLEKGIGAIDTVNIERLCDWLEIPLCRVFQSDLSTIIEPDKPMPVIIDELIMKDNNLTGNAKAFLSRFFSESYINCLEYEIRS